MRTLVCLAQCRCVVCGTEVAPGPIYRPADGEEAEFVAVALRFGKLYRNAAPTREASGRSAGAFRGRGRYDDNSLDISDQRLDIFYGQLVELLSYASGTDLLAELHAEITREQEPAKA
jgi:hypothetical protein